MLADVLPDPWHPAVVHLPVALAMLLPLVALGALWTIRRGATPRRVWGVATLGFAILTFSAWLAVQTGEATAERVERIVAEQPLETHEERGESFFVLTLVTLAIAAAGLVRGRIGDVARLASTIGSLVLFGVGWLVGHSGGALVYKHGAASAYATPPTTAPVAEPRISEDDAPR